MRNFVLAAGLILVACGSSTSMGSATCRDWTDTMSTGDREARSLAFLANIWRSTGTSTEPTAYLAGRFSEDLKQACLADPNALAVTVALTSYERVDTYRPN